MNSENLQLKEERDRHVRELSDMSEVGKRRDQELIRIEEELKTTNEELQKANAAKVINPIYTLIVPEYIVFLLNQIHTFLINWEFSVMH